MNHIICVIDRSGSMASIKSDAIGGFNEFLKGQKADGTDDVLTYIQFDDQYEVVFTRRPIDKVEPMTDDTFIPRGTTGVTASRAAT